MASMLGSVDIKVRPLRFACLVDPGDAAQIRAAIRLNSTLWGGDYFPIIPLYKRLPRSWKDHFKLPAARDVTLGYLEAFDPDVLVQFSCELPAYIGETKRKIIKPENVWQATSDGVQRTPRFGVGVFELLWAIFEEHFKYKAKFPPKMWLPRIPEDLALFWSALYGELPPDIAAAVRRDDADALEIKEVDCSAETLPDLLSGGSLFPRRWTQHALMPTGPRSSRGDASVFFMDAAKSEDVVDFWNLRALGGSVFPLPKQLKEAEPYRQCLVAFLKDKRRHWPHDPRVCNLATIICSRNSTMDELQDYAKTLIIERPAQDPSSDGYFMLQRWYPRVWDDWARDKDGAVPRDTYTGVDNSIDINDPATLRVRLKPLRPSFSDDGWGHSEGRCANEVSFRLFGATEYLAEVFPQSSGENFTTAISGLSSFDDWRVGRHGLVRIVTNEMSESREIPTGEDIFFAWLTDCGWKPQLSPAGILAKQIYRTLEGQPFAITNPELLGLLEHMNGGRVSKSLQPADDNKISQERDLPVAEVRSRISSFSGRGNLYDHLLDKRVFRLGLRVKCPGCSRHSWFPLAMVRDEFVCPLCLNPFPALNNIDGSTWSYKTAGPFSVANYAEGAYAVLLALQCFDDRKMTTMRISPVLSFTAEGPKKEKLEADFALFWQESLYGERTEGVAFGECKTYGCFEEKDFARMRRLATAFPGAVLVFATLRKTLTTKEIRKLAGIARAGRKRWKAERQLNPVLVLTGSELLSHKGAPYCWEEPLKSRFRHERGLMRLCDITQQLYLNLPSWHDERERRWARKSVAAR